ncbi:hypothetical protein PDESU_05012 [Pontiella desulfatans]|uniref:Lambda-carrageenase beta-propeller domain-containing protein n=1 Tax=Pontiella desulfatans TaxID=2750659 RepID=A0A6C2UA73_PONDE|nr:hypothetical protein [Pontiella desulfatans]VGO16421.1 hypothetical protein PDESU_05012 [Pontiella desulfatans]
MKKRKWIAGLILVSVTGLIASVAQASVPSTVFQAGFETSTLINDTVTASNLDAGTAVGSWTVIDDQESDIRSGSGNKALLADTGTYSFEANFSETAVLTNNGVSISLDTYMRRTGDASSSENNLKPQKIVGLASHGYELFDIRITAGISHENGQRVGFIDSLGVERYLGSSGDVNTYSVDTPNSSMFQTLELTLHETTMDISYDGAVLTNGIAYRNLGMSHLRSIRLAGVNGNTGAFYDNIAVSASVVSTNENWPRTGFVPHNTQGDNLIHVRTADFDGVGAKDYVVAMSVDEKLIAFNRPEDITDPAADNRRWQVDLPNFAIMIETADIDQNSGPEEVLVPGTDGHLRIYTETGALRGDWPISDGALYCVGVGQQSNGDARIITGGVDGDLYFYDETGSQIGTVRPQNVGIIRRLAVGNFDGVGGDEVMIFYSMKGYDAYRYIEIYDLDTLVRPAYWDLTEPMEDDVARINASPGMGWTDKQTAWVYDMDGDGDDEVVANWGVLHPENGGTNTILSAALPDGEDLYLSEYENFAETTPTGKYLLQQGVPGNFHEGFTNAEMFTLYGDDLYLVDYDVSRSVDVDRFRVVDYSYAHTLYHFTDGARLEDRSGGPDKMVLAGPAHGDDHFYVVDLSSGMWKEDAKHIDGNGVLGAVRDTLDDLEDDIDAFDGTVAEAGRMISYIDFFGTTLGWEMTQEAIESYADGALKAMQEARDRLGGTEGYMPERVRFVSSMFGTKIWGEGPDSTDPDKTAEGVEAFCAALAERGVHFCVSLGHHSVVHMSPETLADCFEASVVDGVCYLMGQIGEQESAVHIDTYKPHMDAVIERAQLLGVEPPRLITSKGPIFSAMSPAQASTWFPAYKKVFTPGTGSSNNTLPEFFYAERVGLWLNGDVDGWCSSLVGDNLSGNRIAEWGGVRNGHIVLRHMLSHLSLGADIFRITSIVNSENPLYERGDTTDPELDLANPYRQGVWNFLKMVEAGVYPNGPDRSQIKGISPVAAAMPAPNTASLELNAIKHDYTKYATHARPQTYVLNGLSCWDGYTDVPDFDITAILHNSKRRWDNLLPTSPCGFAPIVPHATRAEVEAHAWCRRAYETDVDTWAEFQSLETARDTISAELLAQRTNMLFYVDGECFWQVTENKNDPNTLFVLALDNKVLTPTARTVALTKGAADGVWDVYDQLGSASVPLGTLASGSDSVSIAIPAGSVRILVLKKKLPIDATVMGIAWDGETTPALAINGIDGEIVPSSQGVRADANSTDGFFGADLSGASTAVYGAYQVKDYDDNPASGAITVSVTNNAGSALKLETLHFDFGQWYDASPSNVTVLYRSGDLSSVSNETTLANFSALTLTGWIRGDYEDFAVALTNLSDSTLSPGEHAVFELRATVGTTASSGIDNIAIEVSGLGNYDEWAAGHGLYFSNAWKTVDLEPDGLDNWTEYIFGGDPGIDDTGSILPVFLPRRSEAEAGGNYEYIYRRRSDYLARGLSYTVEATTNLVSGAWSTNGVIDAGVGFLDPATDSVTNRVSTEELPQQFLRLRVE